MTRVAVKDLKKNMIVEERSPFGAAELLVLGDATPTDSGWACAVRCLRNGAPFGVDDGDESTVFEHDDYTGGLKLLLVGRVEETSPAAEPKMRNMQDLSLCHIMQLLHKSEISCGAQFEWDSMLWVWLGNVVGDNKGLRAIEAEECFDISNDEALTVARKWLVKTAQERYPLAAVWKEVEKNGGVA